MTNGIKMMEGFDLVGSNANLNSRGWSVAEGAIGASTGRFGGQGYALSVDNTQTLQLTLEPHNNSPYLSVAFYGKASDLAGNADIFRLQISAVGSAQVAHFFLNRGSGGTSLRIWDANDLLLAELLGVFAANVWNHFEVRAYQDSSIGTLQVLLDGVEVYSGTGLDTVRGTFDRAISWSGDTGQLEWVLDDIVIQHSLSLMPAIVGEHQISTLLADGAGTNSDWTGSYTDVDDPIGASDGDTTYISSSTLNDESDFNFASLSGSPSTILAVLVTTEARKTDAGTKAYTPYLLSNVTQDLGSEHGVSEAYTSFTELYPLDPDGALAWDVAGVNALKAGVKITT